MHDRVALLAALLGLAFVLAGCPADPPVGDSARASSRCANRAVGAAALPAALRLEALPAADRPRFAEIVRVREIDDEPRPVLPGVRAGDAFGRLDLTLPGDARAPLIRRIDLSAGRYLGASAVWVWPRLRVDDWQSLPPVRLPVERDAQGRYATLALDLSAFGAQSGAAKLVATVYVVPDADAVVFQTPSIALPERAGWLAFAVGVPEAARALGAQRFVVEACEAGACRCLYEEVVDPATPAGRGWLDRWLPIGDVAGRRVSLRFTTETLGEAADSMPLAQWSEPRLLAEAAEDVAPKPNVLLISLDTLGARHIDAYGYTRATMPFLGGALASRGVLFENAVAPATTTAPSHMTLFTSLPPSVHGVVSNLRERGLPEGIPTLASLLREAGFVTGSVNEDGAMTRRAGFDRGFDFYVERSGAAIMHPEGFVDETFATGLRFMERHRAEPFFLFLHTYEVHYPYTPPAAYAGYFGDGDDPRHPDNVALGRRRANLYPVLYDREIRRVDDALRALFDRMSESGLLDRTLVVVTSDHGEAFLEHGLAGHGSDVYEEAVHIPLLISGPGVLGGRRIATPVGLIDVAPTVLDWLGLPVPDGLLGHSLAPLLEKDAPSDTHLATRALVSEAWHPWGGAAAERGEIEAPVIGVRLGDKKLIRTKWADGPRYEFYDLSSDPLEQRDAFPAAGPEVAALEAIADAYESASAGILRARGLPPLVADEPSVEDVAPDRVEALRALGYIE